MGEGDHALSSATSEVRGRTFMVAMVSGPAVSTAPVIRAVAGLMPWILAMTSEAVDVRGKGTLSLAKRSSWRGPWVLHPSTLQTVFSFAFCGVIVTGSLCCEDARDDAAGRAPWPGTNEVRDQSCPDCCMGEISLHFILLLFSLQLLSSQLDALLSDGGNAKVLVSEGVYIGNDSRISQMQEGIVNYSAVGSRGMEDGKVSVARGGTIEVRMGEGASMKRGSISGGEFGAFSL